MWRLRGSPGFFRGSPRIGDLLEADSHLGFFFNFRDLTSPLCSIGVENVANQAAKLD